MDRIDFDKVVDRNKSHSVKWDATEKVFGTGDVLPMWVADMDFQPPQAVIDALRERIDHGVFGYTFVPLSVTEAIQDWMKRRHNCEFKASSIVFSEGVVPSISTAIRAFTEKGDKVLVHSPVYTPFFNMVKDNERTLVTSRLIYENERFEIDFENFEAKLQEGVKMFILCNPHNPGGRVWTKEELEKIGDLCLKHDCLIVSDEIHSDLVFEPNVHIPIASINEKFREITVTFVAPSKTFNLAGLQSSAALIPNKELKTKFKRIQQEQGFFTLNTFGIAGIEAAYRHGEEWLDQLLAYLAENMQIATDYISEHLPALKPMKADATYLLWIDCRGLGLNDEEIKDKLLYKGKLGLEPGTKYGEGGEGFVRMNLACPRETLNEGLERLKRAFS
ncbi:MalY/PatB family protein [Mesobacillus subterraneus]|uniref:cysteine-S-conjugate beta-lyase n=1 Tax=Mesobacillus subterraneus TaxID=285983 RepID=A0A3R9FJ42_9BACI|nr:MalY/PatB family protein [Mesobacillus subterraneus]RSD27553.1 pyridoxal phosphate-dependent aminotransferase [Mesobacillus subterraneus]